jgi:hypothetical protein
VQIGDLAGATISLPGSTLRSSGVEILGSGLGSVADEDLVTGIGRFLKALASARFRIAVDARPLSSVESAWVEPNRGKRLVLTVP